MNPPGSPPAAGPGLTGPAFRWAGPASLSSATRIADEFSTWARTQGLSTRWRDRILLVLDELASNVARHGYPPGEPGWLVIEGQRSGDCVRLALTDQGQPFDPTAADVRPSAQSLSGERVGGLGLAIVHNTAATLAYQRLGPTSAPSNRVTFTVGKPAD